jgi:hypothetical protein
MVMAWSRLHTWAWLNLGLVNIGEGMVLGKESQWDFRYHPSTTTGSLYVLQGNGLIIAVPPRKSCDCFLWLGHKKGNCILSSLVVERRLCHNSIPKYLIPIRSMDQWRCTQVMMASPHGTIGGFVFIFLWLTRNVAW